MRITSWWVLKKNRYLLSCQFVSFFPSFPCLPWYISRSLWLGQRDNHPGTHFSDRISIDDPNDRFWQNEGTGVYSHAQATERGNSFFLISYLGSLPWGRPVSAARTAASSLQSLDHSSPPLHLGSLLHEIYSNHIFGGEEPKNWQYKRMPYPFSIHPKSPLWSACRGVGVLKSIHSHV